MGILSIDPGKNFGWAFFSGGKLNAFGDYESREVQHFGRYAEVSFVLSEAREVLGGEIIQVVIENVVQGSCTMPTFQAVWHTVGFQYLATEVAEDMGLPVEPVGNQTLKAYLRKQLGMPGRAKVEKKHIIAYVNDKYDLCLRQKDHNKADAICLGEYYLSKKAG